MSDLTRCHLRFIRVGLVSAAFFLSTGIFWVGTPVAFGEDYPAAGDSPTGSFTYNTDVFIYYNGYPTTGRNIWVELNGQAMDRDIDDEDNPAYDTFDDPDAFKWVITDLATDSPLNLTGPMTSFQTMDGVNPDGQTGSIAMLVKDDGTIYQDWDEPQQVAQMAAQVKDPNGVSFVREDRDPQSNNGIYINNAVKVVAGAAITWQFTLGGAKFMWKGKIREQITSPGNSYRDQDQKSGQDITHDYQDGDVEDTNADGTWVDPHLNGYNKPLPLADKYHVNATKQRFKNNGANDALIPGEFKDYEAIDSVPKFFVTITKI